MTCEGEGEDHEDVGLVLPQKAKKCVACQRGLFVTATEFSPPTVTFSFHQGAVLGAPCVEHFGWPEAQAIGPHLCKTCLSCGFAWPEALPSNDDEER